MPIPLEGDLENFLHFGVRVSHARQIWKMYTAAENDFWCIKLRDVANLAAISTLSPIFMCKKFLF